ncbi:MIP/aquaporin family protein [Kyrpidia tusciae]|uniref:aquaporin n=1 Tax=Kyrpidia tusciae TaxID=33943 RepID=UPI0002FA42C0|nr:aquaporin [Kyrpidia tusciae]
MIFRPFDRFVHVLLNIRRQHPAEGIGTALLVLIGPGCAAFNGVLAGQTHHPVTLADVGVVSLAFGIIVAGMIYAFVHISVSY